MTARPAALLLAAGKGTRMRSVLPKVLHPLLGRPLIRFSADLAQSLASPVVAVLGHGADAVRAALPAGITVAIQAEQRGTADAVRVGLEALGGYDGPVVILSGDAPLLTAATVERLLALSGKLAMATALAPTPRGYGRVVRGPDGLVQRVVEEKDASPAERAIAEVNAGLYQIDAAFLRAQLGALRPDNAQGELYLTDLVAIAAAQGVLSALPCPFAEVAGINDRAELAAARAFLQAEVAARHQAAGVTLVDPASIQIDLDVTLEADVTIEPHCQLTAGTKVAAGTVIRSHSVLEGAQVGADCTVGPFARLRPGTVLARGVHLGNFVETKKARIGAGSKANHLSYLGDAEIGSGVNVGAGTITCNYDGEHKFVTTLGDGVFIGSDTQLIAPVTVGAGAYVGAGTTVDEDVPADGLVFTRAPRVVREGWARRRREARAATEPGKPTEPDKPTEPGRPGG